MYDDKNNYQGGNRRNNTNDDLPIFREDITSNALLTVRIQMSQKNKSHDKRFYAFINASPQAPAGNGETTYLVSRPCMISFKATLTGLAEFAYAIIGVLASQQQKESWTHWADASKAKVNGEAKGGDRDTKCLKVESDLDNKTGSRIVNISFSQTVTARDGQEYEKTSGRNFFSQNSRIKKDNQGNYKHFVNVTLGKFAARAFAEAIIAYVAKARQIEMDLDYRTVIGSVANNRQSQHQSHSSRAESNFNRNSQNSNEQDRPAPPNQTRQVGQSIQSAPQGNSQGQNAPNQYGSWREDTSPRSYKNASSHPF